MPLFPDTQVDLTIKKLLPDEPVEDQADNVPFTEKLSAAFKTENTLGAFLANDVELSDYDPNYIPWVDLTDDERLDEGFVDTAMDANNKRDLDSLRAQSTKERDLRGKLGGLDGFAAMFAAGVVDPINFIPIGGTAYRTYRTGGSVLKGAAITGSVAAGTVTAQEALLHSQQVERTLGESALNISGAMFLGGVLGGASSHFSKKKLDRAIKEVNELLSDANIVREREALERVEIHWKNDEYGQQLASREAAPLKDLDDYSQEWRDQSGPEAIEEHIPLVPDGVSKRSIKAPLEPGVDDLLVAIGKLGGIKKEALLSDGIDPADLAGNIGFGLRLAKKNGRDLDDIAEQLADDGYLTSRDPVELIDKIHQSLTGDMQYSERWIGGFEAKANEAGEADVAYKKHRQEYVQTEEYKTLVNDAEREAFNGFYDEELAILAPELKPSIEAWHGSPHQFEEFSLDSIGTGEGAQAYGHGLYFAENKKVSEDYRASLAKGAFPDGDERNAIVKIVEMRGRDEGEIEARRILSSKYDDATLDKMFEDAREHYDIQRGALYKAKLEVGLEELLDWDKPLNEQPKMIAKIDAITKIPYEESRLFKALADKGHTVEVIEKNRAAYEQRISSLKDSLQEFELGNTTGSVIRSLVSDLSAGEKEGSALLVEQGIKGIRYLDGGSRNKPVKSIIKEFQKELPDDAEFEDVIKLVDEGHFSPAQSEVLKALQGDDWLGFEYPSQAISAAYKEVSRYDASPRLIEAIENTKKEHDLTSNFVIFDDKLIKIESIEYAGHLRTLKASDDYKSLESDLERSTIDEYYQEELKSLAPEYKDVRLSDEEINKWLDEEALEGIASDGEAASGGSIGAAKTSDNIEIKGKLARALVRASKFDPLSRLLTNRFQSARQHAADLVENPIDVDGYTGQALESLIKTRRDSLTYRGIIGNRDAYKEYLKAHGVGKIKAKFSDKALSLKQFNELVAKEIRNEGTENPHVKKAADHWIKEVYEPQSKAMREAGLLGDGEVKTAQRYLNRVWNKDKVAGDLPRFNQLVSRWLVSEGLDEDFAGGLASEIGGRIMSSHESMLPYDHKLGDEFLKVQNKITGDPDRFTSASPFKERVFDIPDRLVEEFLDNDIEMVGARFIRQTSPDIEIMLRHGDPKSSKESIINMNAQKKSIQDDYLAQMERTPDGKQRAKLRAEMNRAILDFDAVLQRIRGQYDIPNEQNMLWRRMGQAARNLNFLRMMGGVTVSSFPDMARLVMAEGTYKAFKGTADNLVRGLKKAPNIPAEDVHWWGIGTDAYTGGRLEVISDISDYTLGGTKLERGLQTMANSYGSINLMNQWTGGMKTIHAISMQSRLMDDYAKGIYPKQLIRLGVDESDAKRIFEQVKKHGRKEGDAWIYNAKNWDDTDLAMTWAGALKKESDRVIIIPGQEKPLFMSSELGKTVFQFKSFMMAATQRIMIAGVQGQDAHMIQGAMAMISMGAMTYLFKNMEAGREVNLTPQVLIAEGIDRSGALGVFMEINNTLEKVSAGHFGLRPMMGIDMPSSRYASRNMSEAITGPTFGSTLSTSLRVMTALSDEGEWSESDTRAIRRLLPYQNLTGFRRGLDEIEKVANESFGVN